MSWAGRGGAGRGRDVHSVLRVSHSVILTELTSHTHRNRGYHLHEFFFLIFLFLNFLVYRKLIESFGSLKIVRNSEVVVSENQGCHLRDSSLVTREFVTWSPRDRHVTRDTWHELHLLPGIQTLMGPGQYLVCHGARSPDWRSHIFSCFCSHLHLG